MGSEGRVKISSARSTNNRSDLKWFGLGNSEMKINYKTMLGEAHRTVRRLWGGLLLLAVLVSGCSPAFHPVKVPVALPEQFSESGTSKLPDRWWLSFEDPVLDGLIEQALAGNFSLKTAWDRLTQAEAVARKEGADLWPTLDVEGGDSRSLDHDADGTSNSSSLSLGLVASYELDLWGRIRSSRDAAAFDLQASSEDLRAAALSLSAEVAEGWYQLVEQYGQLEVLDAQLAANEQILELVTLQFRTGQVSISDVLQQRQLVEANRGERAQAESRAAVFEHQLAILLGVSPQQLEIPRVTSFSALAPMPTTGLPAALVQQRPDLRSAYYGVLAADSTLAAALADRFPRLSLSAQVTTSGEHTRELFNNWLTTLAANLTAPVLDGGLRKAEVDRTRAAASEALNSYAQTILEALGEVEDALIQEQRQGDYISSLNQQLDLAGQVTERVRDRYLKGAVDYQRVLDALLSQQQLQRSLLTARQEQIQYRINLCLALGGGWEMERPEPASN